MTDNILPFPSSAKRQAADMIVDNDPVVSGEALAHRIEGRRVLMLTRDADSAQAVEGALRTRGVPVQTLVSGENGFETERLEDDGGRPALPLGVVVVSDTSSWRGALEAMQATRATCAVIDMIEASKAGSTIDHLLMVTPEEAMRDALDTMNVLLDRMTEAATVDDLGGPFNVPPTVRRFMTWLPRQPGAGARELDAGTRHSRISLDVRPGAGKSLAGMSDDTLESLFGDEAIERERAARMVIVCEDRHDLRDFLVRADLPDAGYDYRAENQAFNQRRSVRGSRGDRRTNRGGRGRR